MAAFVALLEEPGAEHRRGGERDEQRDRDGHGEGDGEFAEELADDAAHEQDGNEDGDQRCAHGEHREADLLGALHGGFIGLHALFEVAGDVLNDHDGVVDDKASGDGERHQRQVVDGVAEQIHHAEGADERKRHGDGGNDGGPDLAQEEEDDEHDEKNADDERNLDVVNAGADGGGAVDRHVHLDRGWDIGLQARHLLQDRVDRVDDIGAGNLEDDDEDGVFEFSAVAGRSCCRRDPPCGCRIRSQ